MTLIPFQKPERVVMQKASDFKGNFEFFPLEKGYGVTIGNAIRRVLLSSLEGFAVTNIKIEGIEQEFSRCEQNIGIFYLQDFYGGPKPSCYFERPIVKLANFGVPAPGSLWKYKEVPT